MATHLQSVKSGPSTPPKSQSTGEHTETPEKKGPTIPGTEAKAPEIQVAEIKAAWTWKCCLELFCFGERGACYELYLIIIIIIIMYFFMCNIFRYIFFIYRYY